MHPNHSVSIDERLEKIQSDVNVAENFEVEDLDDLVSLRPRAWTRIDECLRKEWIDIIKAGKESWDVDMIENFVNQTCPWTY